MQASSKPPASSSCKPKKRSLDAFFSPSPAAKRVALSTENVNTSADDSLYSASAEDLVPLIRSNTKRKRKEKENRDKNSSKDKKKKEAPRKKKLSKKEKAIVALNVKKPQSGFVGASVRKEFPGHGIYSGKVMKKVTTDEGDLWKISYEDGDEEEVDMAELKQILVNGMLPKNESAAGTVQEPTEVITIDDDANVKKDASTEENVINVLEKKEESNQKIEKLNTESAKSSAVSPSSGEKKNAFTFPLVCGGCTVHSIGKIRGSLPKDCASYHTKRAVYPIGFRSTRQYFSPLQPTEKITFTSEIRDGGIKNPVFTVTAPGCKVYESKSATGAWSQVLMAVKMRKVELGLEPKSTNISGPEYFGLTRPEIIAAIEALPGISRCSKYVLRAHSLLSSSIKKKKKAVFPEDLVGKLAAVTDGGHGITNLVEGFRAMFPNRQKALSKRLVGAKIREISSFEIRANDKRKCWYVREELRKDLKLGPLPALITPASSSKKKKMETPESVKKGLLSSHFTPGAAGTTSVFAKFNEDKSSSALTTTKASKTPTPAVPMEPDARIPLLLQKLQKRNDETLATIDEADFRTIAEKSLNELKLKLKNEEKKEEEILTSDHNVIMMHFIQNSQLPLTNLASEISKKMELPKDIVSQKILLSSERKSYGAFVEKSNVISKNENVQTSQIWCWEVLSNDSFSKELRTKLLAGRRKRSLLCRVAKAEAKLISLLKKYPPSVQSIPANAKRICCAEENIQKQARFLEKFLEKEAKLKAKKAEQKSKQEQKRLEREEKIRAKAAEKALRQQNKEKEAREREAAKAEQEKLRMEKKRKGSAAITSFFSTPSSSKKQKRISNSPSSSAPFSSSSVSSSSSMQMKMSPIENDAEISLKEKNLDSFLKNDANVEEKAEAASLDTTRFVTNEWRSRWSSNTSALKKRLRSTKKLPMTNEVENQLLVETKTVRYKYFSFYENHRPAYFGTFRKRSSTVSRRKPFAKDKTMDYEVDSDEEWEDCPDGEDVEFSDDEEEKEEKEADYELDDWLCSDEEMEYVGNEGESSQDGDKKKGKSSERRAWKEKKKRTIADRTANKAAMIVGPFFSSTKQCALPPGFGSLRMVQLIPEFTTEMLKPPLTAMEEEGLKRKAVEMKALAKKEDKERRAMEKAKAKEEKAKAKEARAQEREEKQANEVRLREEKKKARENRKKMNAAQLKMLAIILHGNESKAKVIETYRVQEKKKFGGGDSIYLPTVKAAIESAITMLAKKEKRPGDRRATFYVHPKFLDEMKIVDAKTNSATKPSTPGPSSSSSGNIKAVLQGSGAKLVNPFDTPSEGKIGSGKVAKNSSSGKAIPTKSSKKTPKANILSLFKAKEGETKAISSLFDYVPPSNSSVFNTAPPVAWSNLTNKGVVDLTANDKNDVETETKLSSIIKSHPIQDFALPDSFGEKK
eukprot:g4923.t1